MTAVIYHLDDKETGQTDETERLLSALGRYTSAELLELLYIGEEPGFFDLIRGIFALSEQSRSILLNFLSTARLQQMSVSVDPEGRCVIGPQASPDLA